MTEKELVEKVLRDRAIVKSDNTLDKIRYMKLITEPWIRKRVETYGWLKQPICAIEKTTDLSDENKPVDETLNTVEKVPQIENKAPENVELNVELTPTVPEQEKPVVEELSLEKFVVDPVVLKTAVVEEPVEEKVAEEPAAEETVEEKVAEEPATEEVVEEKVAEEPAAEETVEENNTVPATEEVVVEETSEAAAPKKTRKKKN